MGAMFRAAILFIARPRLAVISALTWGTISDSTPVGAARLSVGAANQSKRKQTCKNDFQHFLLLRPVTTFQTPLHRFRLFLRMRTRTLSYATPVNASSNQRHWSSSVSRGD